MRRPPILPHGADHRLVHRLWIIAAAIGVLLCECALHATDVAVKGDGAGDIIVAQVAVEDEATPDFEITVLRRDSFAQSVDAGEENRFS